MRATWLRVGMLARSEKELEYGGEGVGGERTEEEEQQQKQQQQQQQRRRQRQRHYHHYHRHHHHHHHHRHKWRQQQTHQAIGDVASVMTGRRCGEVLVACNEAPPPPPPPLPAPPPLGTTTPPTSSLHANFPSTGALGEPRGRQGREPERAGGSWRELAEGSPASGERA
ncbi:hypothetical protein HZH66_000559 [Vespula vulgaris]|uniref:Uncharacterized protein n=1 Tax=Vespula vulgaris TaxID=7454 RepID=A0A834NL73_VESVU|nr:hypothetical protein HZH66_000559 [Vespula vulgaris]